MATIVDRFRRVVNAFANDESEYSNHDFGSYGVATSIRPDRIRSNFFNDRSIISSIYTRIAVDCASVTLKHVRLDDQDRYLEDVDSGLNSCLTLEANIDQAARAFRQDIFATLCDEGVAVIVPVDTTLNPKLTSSYDILTMRVGRVINWFPRHVRVSLYNELTGKRQEITLPKAQVAIVENPLFAVMNEPNSTLQRLIRKLTLLDAVDEQSASGKLDLIIQLPYVIKSESRKLQAEQRRSDIEFQLKGSKYGIAYTDGTEKITQLNRPAENNLLGQVEYLMTMLYGELGITKAVMDGTADEKTMLNYWNRTIEPMVTAAVEAMKRNFLTKTARTQKQTVLYFRDPFKLIPINDIAEIADKFTRNEILSSNEIRQVVGFKPAQDPKADQLVNSNMPQADTGVVSEDPTVDETDDTDPNGDQAAAEMNGAFDSMDEELDSIFKELGVEEGDDSA